MGEKRQWLESTRGSRIAAIYYAILSLVEEGAEEEDRSIENILLEEIVLDPITIADNSRTTLRVRSNLARSYNMEAAGIAVSIEPDPELVGVPAIELYQRVPVWVIREDSLGLKKMASHTSMTGVEFIALYTLEGQRLVLEGEYLRVRLPFVKVVASVHTHPPSGCGLSMADIASGLDLLAETGLFEAAVTTTCAAILYRVGPVDEEDYVEARRALLAARRSKHLPQLRLKTIRLTVTGY